MRGVHLIVMGMVIGAHIKLILMEITNMGKLEVVITTVTNKYILAVTVNGISILNWTMQKILKLLTASMTQILEENGIPPLLHVCH